MKKIKCLLIIIIILLVSGCKINYKLVISDDKICENISVNADNTIENQFNLNREYYPLHHSREITYGKDIKRNGNKANMKLHYDYSLEYFFNANSFNQHFRNRNVVIDDDFISISLSDMSGFAPNVDFDIEIKTENKVVSNNADKVKGHSYIWHVDGNNKEKMDIEIKIKRGTTPTVVERNMYIVYIVIAIVVVAISVIAFITYRRRKVNNKI